MKEENLEIITHVAIKSYYGTIYSLPCPPNNHFQLTKVLLYIGVKRAPQYVQGFLTSSGRFVDRTEARRIALAANQVSNAPHRNELVSIDLITAPSPAKESWIDKGLYWLKSHL